MLYDDIQACIPGGIALWVEKHIGHVAYNVWHDPNEYSTMMMFTLYVLSECSVARAMLLIC